MEYTPDTRFSQPDPAPHEDATIREIMEKQGISYADARLKWDMMKAEVDKQLLLDKESEDEQNG